MKPGRTELVYIHIAGGSGLDLLLHTVPVKGAEGRLAGLMRAEPASERGAEGVSDWSGAGESTVPGVEEEEEQREEGT